MLEIGIFVRWTPKNQNRNIQHRNRKIITPYLKPSSILVKDNPPIRPRIRDRLAIRIGATKSPEKNLPDKF